jgi:predicted dehydrogenase
MSPPLAVGVVGCGYWGPNLARTFNLDPRATVRAICDLNPERLDRVSGNYPGAKAFADFEAMLASGRLDAVVIATPVKTHHEIAKAALLAGKHVLVEKPMAASASECEDLIGIATSRGLTLMVSHTYLYAPAVRRIAEFIHGGEIGELKYINGQRLNLGLFQSDINVAWDLAPHDLSIILHMMGELPVSLNCQGNSHVTPGIEDVTNLSLTFPNQRFATVQSSWIEPRKVRQMTFVGTRKMITYDDLQPLEKIRIYDVRVERPPHYEDFAEFQYAYHYGDCYLPRIEQSEPLKIMCSHFIDCVLSGSEPLSGGLRGLELVRILEASSASLRAGGGPIGTAGIRGHDTGPLTMQSAQGRSTGLLPK